MSFFDDAYDEMSWQEVCYRLPGDLAVNALKRRVNNLDTLRMFFDNIGTQPSSITPLKEHVNTVIENEDVDDILNTFGEEYQPVLFGWMTNANAKRIKNHDASKLSMKFLFNLTDSSDKDGLGSIFDRILAEPCINQSHLRAVLRKADDNCLPPLLNQIIKDSRPEVRAHILSVPGLTNKEMVSDMQKVIGLKALAKCSGHQPIKSINTIGMNVFSNLRPLERLQALDIYFSYFPSYRRINVFDPMPTEEEFKLILFAGCIEHNEWVEKLHKRFQQIALQDPPNDEKEDENEV